MLGFYFTNVRPFVNTDVLDRCVREQGSARYPGIAEADRRKLVEEERKTAVINTFDLVLLQKVGQAAAGAIENPTANVGPNDIFGQSFFKKGFQLTMFLLLFVGFAIKVPVF